MIAMLNFNDCISDPNSLFKMGFFIEWIQPDRIFDPNGYLSFVPGIVQALGTMILNTI